MRTWFGVLALLVLVTTIAAVLAADDAVSVTWSNTTVAAGTGLLLALTTGDNPLLPVDAVVTIQLGEHFAMAANATVDTAALQTSANGSWSVRLSDHTLTVQRGGDGLVVSAGTLLLFKMSGVSNPTRAGRFEVGTMNLTSGSDTTARSLSLSTIEIAPGGIWKPQLTFGNLLSGRNTTLEIHMTPGNSVPKDGAIVVDMPYMYNSLLGVTVSSVVGLDGDFELSTKNNRIQIHRAGLSASDSVGMQEIVVGLDGIVHPLLEGSMGSQVLLQTIDSFSQIIDQEYVDSSGNFLSKARAQISKSSLSVKEGDAVGGQYSIVLNAPPCGESPITLSVGDSQSRAELSLVPQLAVFTAANWSTAVLVTVTASDDSIVSGNASVENIVTIPHQVLNGDDSGTFSPIDEVEVHISENDFPGVHISDRFLAVIESLRNDSYEIVLLSQPISDVTIHMSPEASFILTDPAEVVFTSSSWNTPKLVNVLASVVTSSVRGTSGILHQIISSDINYNGKVDEVFPQNEVLVYYEPLVAEACVEPCRAGWFPLVNATTGNSQCVGCPLGYYCRGSCLAPVPCPQGTSSSTEFAQNATACVACSTGTYAHVSGLNACLVCPAGSFCSAANAVYQACPAGSFSSVSEQQCHDCPAGTYNNQASQSACSLCPQGYYCPKGSINPVPCTTGTFSMNSGATPCATCPAGFSCSDPTIGPVVCPPGTYSLGNSTSCVACPSGYSCSTADRAPQLCGTGYYSAQASTSCTVCPRGYQCSSNSSAQPVACAQGLYNSIAGGATCHVCPAGYSCIDSTQPPALCQLGSYSLEGDHICSPCPAGSYCPGQYQAPMKCATGTYALGNATVCTPCGIGVNCFTNAAPVVCPTGYYSTNSTTPCELCDAGSYCPSPSQPPIKCTQGTYSYRGAAACTPCPYGYSCTVDGALQACGLGQTNSADHSACMPCPKGYDCSPLLSATTPCPIGTYSLEGDGHCTTCPQGFKCASTTDAPVQCVGTGVYSPAGATDCKECPAGSYCPQPSSDPIPCPAWYYSGTSSTACTPCSAGMDCSSASVPPVPCANGTYSLRPASACLLCPAGSACMNTTTAPVACAPGNFSVQGQTQCAICAAGFYCPQTGQIAQLPCPDGTFAEGNGAISCTTCPAGMQCPSKTQAIKEACLPGTYSLGGQAHCVSCPIGNMCPLGDGSQNAVCAPGWFSMGGAVECTICPAGYACPNPASSPPVVCPDGYFSLVGSTLCTPCPAGYACPDSTTKLLVPCTKGTYSTGAASSCTPCPAGYQCSFTNSSSFELCPTGYYSTTGAGACAECPRGYYCDQPSEMPKNCSVGYYSMRASTSCLACDPGYECPRSDQLPQPCPVGYYSEGAVANCRSCRPGYKCSLASTNPTPLEDACPMGGYCNPPTTFFLCPAGTFGNTTAGESIDQACEPCPEGYYCEMGSTPLTRQTCPTGFFCPEGTERASQSPCPAGTYNPQAGQKSSSVCQPCPTGSYCPTGCSDPLICAKGYYCLNGTRAVDQYPCPAGTFNQQTGLTDATQCAICPLGSYCPEGSSSPTNCPAGTYNPMTGAAGRHECLDCPPGWSCPHVGQYAYVDQCAKGHYCPGATVLATDHPCPAGTYTESVELIRYQDCTICPLRHACLQGTGGTTQTILDCGAGFFCPNGTAYSNQFPCLPGTWSSSTSLSAAEECEICPEGKYCQGGKSFIDGNCSAGYYCPLGTASSTQYPCPAGTYTAKTWLFEPSQCDDCPPGYYCPAGSIAPIPCKPGSYTSVNNTKTVGPGDTWPSCITCPAGYLCVEASITPTPCGKGKFSAIGANVCSMCEAGYFCNSNVTSAVNMRSNAIGWSSPGALYGACYNGTYCPPGSDSEPALETDACPPGYFCPTATPAPVICPAGTYSNLTGQDSMSDCTPTPAGYYSLAGALAPTGICSPGFYCPLRSTSQTQVPCPARYYLNRTNGGSEEDCAVCVSGAYCPIGTAYPIVCPAGYYCRTGVSSPEPCPIGTYSNATGLRQVSDCLLCPPGTYCDSTALTVPRGLCDPGYYCTLGAYTSAPMNYEPTLFGVNNKNTGGQCPQGFYCPLGSASPTLCPPGTFNNFTGLESEAQCVPCPAGEYCETPGLLLPTGNCNAGYYCTGGASVPVQMETPAGYFSLVGATAPSPCPPGQYNLYPKQNQCLVCPAGFYCGIPGTISPSTCPTGNYCPEGTSLPVKCPPGTFNAVELMVTLDQCKACPEGQYCDSYGLSASSGPCLAGFVCTGGSPIANPVNQTYGYVCPAANYCPEGSGKPVQCPQGSYRATTGGTSLESCSLCPGGEYCSATALTSPTGPCRAGYYCVSNSSTPTPTDGFIGAICPAGFYCPEASPAPVKCAAGTYAASTGQSVCNPCPMGYFCDGVTTNTYASCPAGHYCPLGTAEVPDPCPVGTFSGAIQLTNVTECLNCTAGFFCGSLGMVSPTGQCSPGSFCPPRSESTFGKTADNDTHVCPPGSYCPEGTYLPLPCPVGSYSNKTGLVKSEDCTFCDEGAYCAISGLVTPSGLCDAGYFCKRNNTGSSPLSGVVKIVASSSNGSELDIYFGGQACSTGSYCPKGSASPILCPEGSYTNATGSPVCLLCPPGYFCPLGCNDYLSNLCPLGYYCPQGTLRARQFPCPPGSFGNSTGLQGLSQCIPSPGGTFIDSYAAVEPTGNCSSGFYCSGGSPTGTPAEITTTGGPCLPGTNCPQGSAIPIVCNAGAYCSATNLNAALPCKEGFYCVQGSYTPTPTGQNNSLGMIGDICTRGHYCPLGTSNPIPCPPGTFSETTQNVDASYCLPCSAGFICNASGIVTPDEKCPQGFYCTGGESVATQRCPKGFECPEQTSQPQSCAAGTFADETGLAQCKVCPERFYCKAGCSEPVQCPQGYYCPLQTPSSSKYPCLAGTFGDQPGLASSAECAACPQGRFCSGLAPTNQTSGACAPGYYCAGGAQTAQPEDGITGGLCESGHVCLGGAWLPDPADNVTGKICDPGYYCPVGSSSQIRCAKGTYNSVEKQSSCVICPAGGYCDTNATTPIPCPLRYYCPEGVVDPVLCPSGTYGYQTGLANATQCAPCSAGKYCLSGTETAPCAAGYYCTLSNIDPNPIAMNTYATNSSLCASTLWRTELGGPCPVGYYCPKGVASPIPCPRNLSRLETFGASVDDCTACPAGMSCRDGANTVTCPAGSYCPQGVSDVPCPAGKYNPYTGKSMLEDCLPCVAGKLCNRTGIVNLTNYDCPAGNYCLNGSSVAQPCQEGKFRATQGAKRPEDCDLCIGGSFCTAGVPGPTVCDATTYCPIGSGSPLICPGGSYCPYNTTTPVICPEGFFCPPATGVPLICTIGHYCPSGTQAQTPCPLGYLGRLTPLDGAYTNLYSSCEACPPGTFGIDANRSRCDECLEGYVCLGATNSSRPASREVDRGYPCPPGYYCPGGSSLEMACPNGTYQPSLMATNASACQLCPVNSYQNLVGQASCLPCSTSSYSSMGATKCTCVGSHRAFQMTDGYCICEPGYEFYDQNMILRSDEDGQVDCQPIVYNRCGSNQVRSDDGSCVSPSSTACDASCNNGTGTYVASLGVCQCDNQPDLDTICDKKCRDDAVQIQVNSTTGELQLYNPLTGEISPLADGVSASGLVSTVSCPAGSDCQLQALAMASTGFSGSYGVPPAISDLASRRRRRLTTTSSAPIANPMVCLNVGSGLIFDLSVPRSYPIYLKDSMLNTNPSFDYGAFRALAAKINANSSSVTAFAFSFADAGTYVFGNSLNAASQTIVVVMKQGTTCPTEAPIVPLNEKNLITVSAKRRTDDIILAPDWALIIGVLGGLFGVVIAVIAGLYYFRVKSWTNTAIKGVDGYRAKSKQINLAAMHSKGTVAVNTNETEAGGDLPTAEPTTTAIKQLQLGRKGTNKGNGLEYQADLGRWDEEDLDLRELVDRLQFHHEVVTKTFEDQKGDVKQLVQHLQAEATELKRLFVDALVSSDLIQALPKTDSEVGGVEPTKGETRTNGLPPLSAVSGRPRSKSVADREKFLLGNLERDLQDRRQFEKKKTGMLNGISAGLKEIQDWSGQLEELTNALVQEMSSPANDSAPEHTTTNESSTCLERTKSVLEDLKTMLGSDPMTQTSSSLIHLVQVEKGRREVGNFVLEASQRYFVEPLSGARASSEVDTTIVDRLLELHDDVEKAQNKEDEAFVDPLPSLQKFGAALPQVLATLEDLERSFHWELDFVREQQNPVKERMIQVQMQSRLSKLLKEVAAGAKKVNEKLEKVASHAVKHHNSAERAEGALSQTLASAKEQWRMAEQEQADRIAATSVRTVQNAQLDSLPSLSTATPNEPEDSVRTRNDTLFQIKELLVELTAMLRTHSMPSIVMPQSRNIAGAGPNDLVETRAPVEVKRKVEPEAKARSAEYAATLDASYPNLSAVEKERLLDDFAADLRTIQTSVSIETTRSEAELATRQAASEVLRDAQKAQVQRRELEDANLLRAQHDEEEESLESQFRQEELAIEQEYLKELSSLEKEFGDTDGGAVFAEPQHDKFGEDGEDTAGDESCPPEIAEGENKFTQRESALFAAAVDDNADIIAQLNDVYLQALNDRARLLDMEDAIRKEQLSERLRRKRDQKKDNATTSAPNEDATLASEKEVQELITEAAERMEAALEEIVKKQDDMDALQQEAVHSAVANLRERVAVCKAAAARTDDDFNGDTSAMIDAVAALAASVRNEARTKKMESEEAVAKAEDELRQLQSDYERDFTALRDVIDNERLRLQAKLHEKLLNKHRRHPSKAGSKREINADDLLAESDASGVDLGDEMMETELEAFTDQAIEDLKDKHLQLQREMEHRKVTAKIAVAAAEAQLTYLDSLDVSGEVPSKPSTLHPDVVETPRECLRIASDVLETLTTQIPAQIEQQSQQTFDKLHGDYMVACAKRRMELEADTATQKAKLHENMTRRRRENQDGSLRSTIESIGDLDRITVDKIDEKLKAALVKLDENEKQVGKTLGMALSSRLHQSAKEVEKLLRQCQQKHEVALSKLKANEKSTELERSMIGALDMLEDKAAQRQASAAQARESTELEIERLRDESESALVALSQALDAEKRRQEQRLQQRMAQRREQQRRQLPAGSSPEEVVEMDNIITNQEIMERQRLEDQLELQAQLAFTEGRTKQRENEDRLSEQLRDACVEEAVACTTKRILGQAREEYIGSGGGDLARLVRSWKAQNPRNSFVKETLEMSERKKSVVARLAAIAAPGLVPQNNFKGVRDGNTVESTMAAELEQQIKSLSASHLKAWERGQQELQEEETRRKADQGDRLRRRKEARRQASVSSNNLLVDDEKEEEEKSLLAQLESAAIDRKFALEAELDAELEQLAAAIQSAGAQSSTDIEGLLEACRSSFNTEVAALHDALRVQRQAQQEALRQRLLQKRRDKLQELDASGKAKDSEAVADLDSALRIEEADGLSQIAKSETQRLSELQQRLQCEVDQAFADADGKAKVRWDEAKTQLLNRENELENIHREHAESIQALHDALEVERRRQQNKLLERTARRKAERLAELTQEHSDGVPKTVEHRAMEVLEKEHERERLRLDDTMNGQEIAAQQDLSDKIQAKEVALRADARRLRGEVEAAQAAREALAAAHCAEVDRVTQEFYTCLADTDGVDVETLRAKDRRRRLDERLAAKRAEKGGKLSFSFPLEPRAGTGTTSAVDAVVVDDLDHELEKLHELHKREWGDLQKRLEDETCLRKAQLADRLKRKRQQLENNDKMTPSEKIQAEAALNREEEQEKAVIDTSAACAARALALNVQHAREKSADILAASYAGSSDDVDALLAATRRAHDEAHKKLREALEMDRRMQEQLLKERLRQRRTAQRGNREEASSSEAEQADETEQYRQLDEKLTAQEKEAWTALRDREKHEVDGTLAPLEAAIINRRDAAAHGENEAKGELERLAAEHERHLAELRQSLEDEKKRQQLSLRDKLRRKREKRLADGVQLSPEDEKDEERQAIEALETSFEAHAAKMEVEVLDARREKETDLITKLCAYSASRAAGDAALTMLDGARIEAERVRAEYEASLATRLQGATAERSLGRDEIARRLAERKQKRMLLQQQQHEQERRRSYTTTAAVSGSVGMRTEIAPTGSKLEDDNFFDREIANVRAAHTRGVESRRGILEADVASRKAALAARLERKRRAAAFAEVGGPNPVPEEVEKALRREEQDELAVIVRDHIAREGQLTADAQRERELLETNFREANERGAEDIERLLTACKLAHEAESTKLEESLRAERARQELALKQRLAAKKQRRKIEGDLGAVGMDESEGISQEEVDRAQAELDEYERDARQELAERQQRELADVTRKLEGEAEAQRKAAMDLHTAAERELRRLEEEHARKRRALEEALRADQRQREAQLREKLAKKKAARQAKSSSIQQDAYLAAEEAEAIAALQEQLMQEQATLVAHERAKQEAAMRQAESELQEAAAAAAKAAAASRHAQEEAVRVAAEFDRHHGETRQLQAAEASSAKQKLADRLAEKKLRQKLKKPNVVTKTRDESEQDAAERLRLEAHIEAQLAACRETHDAEAAKLRETLRSERERQEHALQERIARRKEKRAIANAQIAAKEDLKAAEEIEKQQQIEEEEELAAALAAKEKQAWEYIQHKQDEDLRALQELKSRQERAHAEHQKQLADQEMNRLQEEHERELRALTASIAQEQARQEDKLQQRIAQRRAKKQRQEDEAAASAARLQQSSASAEEEAQAAAESERADALAQAQAQAEAEAEEKERHEIAKRLGQKLEDERARQQREKDALAERLAREAEAQAAKRAEALALQLQQQASETADKMVHEFDTNLRELRQTHSADGAAQKARLEARIAAKKSRKLRELEEKRELERQRLHARQEQEAEQAAVAETEREAALDEAAGQATSPAAEENVPADQPAVAELSADEEKAGALLRAARQQQRDIAAVRQLFSYGLVPQKLSLLGAVELVVGMRHERELEVQLTELAARTGESVRRVLQVVTQQKASTKAQALEDIVRHYGSEGDNNEVKAESERILSQLDCKFAEKIKEAEQGALAESDGIRSQAEKSLKARQMREIALLLSYFDAQHSAALVNVSAANTVQLQASHTKQPTMNAAQREAEDLVNELRARLELEADDRRRELEEEKRRELEQLSTEEQDELREVDSRLATVLAEEKTAMSNLLSSRLTGLPAGKTKQREAAEREHSAQLQRLSLMLEGRGEQQKARVRARKLQQRSLIEEEFRRKAQVVISVMNQRLAQEKADLRQRQELFVVPTAPPIQQEQSQNTSPSLVTEDLAKRLESVLEERLTKIEQLVAAFKHEAANLREEAETIDIKPSENNDATTYRRAVAEAMSVGCRLKRSTAMDKKIPPTSASLGVLDPITLDTSRTKQVSPDELDDRIRARRDFAELLLRILAPTEGAGFGLTVAETVGPSNGNGGDYACLSLSTNGGSTGNGTMYLSLSALQELSTGQLAVVIMHALAQARAHTSDMTEPEFISHLYALLVRCYQGLFVHVQQQKQISTTPTTQPRKSIVASGGVGSNDVASGAQWHSRLHEMEVFLTRLGGQPTAPASAHTLAQLQSSRLRLLSKQDGSESKSDLESEPWQLEQVPLLQEKLDTAEKLYLQVLRQHEQQTETVEYWHDLLVEQRDAEYDEEAFDEEDENEDEEKPRREDPAALERQKEREVRLQEAQSELDRAAHALESTRKARDELFTQCQLLRDQLGRLRGKQIAQ